MESNRRQRRGIRKRQGALFVKRYFLEDAALSEAVANGAPPVDLVMYLTSTALEELIGEGAHVLAHTVVTIGRHPDHPGGVTIEAKCDVPVPPEPKSASPEEGEVGIGEPELDV